jgi:hypothetical protein
VSTLGERLRYGRSFIDFFGGGPPATCFLVWAENPLESCAPRVPFDCGVHTTSFWPDGSFASLIFISCFLRKAAAEDIPFNTNERYILLITARQECKCGKNFFNKKNFFLIIPEIQMKYSSVVFLLLQPRP